MAYQIYIDGTALPVTPEKISMQSPGQNAVVRLIDGREAVVPQPPGLTEISFEALLPNVRYPFAVYERGFRRADYYLAQLELLRKRQEPFRLIISRNMPDGTPLGDTNLSVLLDRMEVQEQDADVTVSLTFRQYVKCGMRTPAAGKTAVNQKTRMSAATTGSVRHTVAKGDCLWNLTQKYWGDGNRYAEVYAKNQTVIDAGNRGTGNPRYTIYSGQVLQF